MKRDHKLRQRITRDVAVAALGSLLALGAGPLRADDPYPPLNAEAQKAVDEARLQMRAIDALRQLERQQRIARADTAGAPAQEPQLDTLDPSLERN